MMIKRFHKFSLETDNGCLDFMVTWISLDGRLEIKYHSSLENAMQHLENLKLIGRQSELWIRNLALQVKKPKPKSNKSKSLYLDGGILRPPRKYERIFRTKYGR